MQNHALTVFKVPLLTDNLLHIQCTHFSQTYQVKHVAYPDNMFGLVLFQLEKRFNSLEVEEKQSAKQNVIICILCVFPALL